MPKIYGIEQGLLKILQGESYIKLGRKKQKVTYTTLTLEWPSKIDLWLTMRLHELPWCYLVLVWYSIVMKLIKSCNFKDCRYKTSILRVLDYIKHSGCSNEDEKKLMFVASGDIVWKIFFLVNQQIVKMIKLSSSSL